ncbi:hypothetical protein BDY24DRAFT_384615 [Mrakia frigida]|uniref:uncharacterized protein n=1 Tax=Mrakia frigida TaxID=29902 RepID=UPI003FCC168E
MFEEACFSCGGPTAGSLYCSDACERKDKEPLAQEPSTTTIGGRTIPSPPPFSSPLFGAVPALVPSSRSGRANSSASSPTTSSPNTSPSPWAESQNVVNGSPPPTLYLPPQAYPSSRPQPVAPDPVKIPPSSSFVGSIEALRDGGGETLKFTRRPGPTNNPTSPLALFPVGRHVRTSSSAYGSVSSSLGLSSIDGRAANGVRTDRPPPVGFSSPRIKSDSSVVIRRTKGSDSRGISDDDAPGGPLDRDVFVPPSYTNSAFARIPPYHQDFAPPPLPLSPRVAPSSDGPRPSPSRRRSVPMHHCSNSPTSNAISSTSSQSTVAPSSRNNLQSPLASSEMLPPALPHVGRGRSQRTDEHSVDSSHHTSSRSRSSALGSRSGTRSRTREGEDRPRRGSSRSEIDDEPRRGRRGSSRLSEGSTSEAGDESEREMSRGRRERDQTVTRGRGASGRTSDPPPPSQPRLGPTTEYLPVFDRTPEHRGRDLSTSPDSLANGGGATIRGRRPTVTVKPSAFTALNGGGTVRTEAPSSSASRSRDRRVREEVDSAGREDHRAAVEDLRGRLQGVKVQAS